MTQRTPCPSPERIDADPEVALVAYRWPSSRVPGVWYHVALLVGEDCGQPVTFWECSCAGFAYRDTCQHVTAARVLLANEERAEDRQAQLDARLGCRHPLTVDEFEEDWAEQRTRVHRECVGCGLRVENRGDVFDRLEDDIRERHRLPSSPYTALERSEDPS